MKLTNVTLNNQCGIVQILEYKDTQPIDNRTVSLSFQAKTTSSEISNLRAAILTWGSTADVVTSDVIATWASDGTTPTWATNWTMENVPVNLPLTNSWAQYRVENVLVDTATVNNLAVVIWVDDGTITAGDDIWISQVQLNIGVTSGLFQPKGYTQELDNCKRYFQKYTNPRMNGVVGAGGGASIARFGMQIPEMRTTPTAVWGNINVFEGNVATTVNAVGATYYSPTQIEADITTAAGLTANVSPTSYAGGANPTLAIDAEL
jgi:hypothetical protein